MRWILLMLPYRSFRFGGSSLYDYYVKKNQETGFKELPNEGHRSAVKSGWW